jgi:hypothetical protein
MFKVEGPRLDRLFSGQPVAIKKDIDMDQAGKYRVAFRNAGALVEIRPADSTPSLNSQPTDSGSPPQTLTVSPAKGFDLSDCTVAAPPREIPDISGMRLDRPGTILDETEPPIPLAIDTEALQLDKPGVTLDQTDPPPAAEIDTDSLTLNPPNQGSLEEYRRDPEPAALPDIDHLEVTDHDEPQRT